jgi:hypothetical protein
MRSDAEPQHIRFRLNSTENNNSPSRFFDFSIAVCLLSTGLYLSNTGAPAALRHKKYRKALQCSPVKDAVPSGGNGCIPH